MPKYYIGVASRQHVARGVLGGFCQLCHGKPGPLKRMEANDWIVYYSPSEIYGKALPCRKFTAIGKILEGEPYPFRMGDDFIPWRRNVLFYPATEVPIEPLIAQFSFIKDKSRWGLPFRSGCLSIPKHDFELIAEKMGIDIDAV